MSTNKLFLNIYKLCKFLVLTLLLTISSEAYHKSMEEKLHYELFDDIRNGYIKGVENYINKGNDLNFFFYGFKTPLMQAAYCNQIEILKLLIEAGANVNAEKKAGNTAISFAVGLENTEIIKLLIEAGADPKGELISAINSNKIECIKQLIASKIDLNSDKHFGLKPIQYAINTNRIEAVKLLIEGKANLNITDDHGETLLMRAILKGQTEIVRLLIEGKADLNIRNIDGHTPLTIAIRYNHVEIVKLLMLVQPDYRKSKLEHAIISGDIQAVKEHAASSIGYWDSCTPDKERALALALLTKQTEIFSYLCETWNVPTDDYSFKSILRTILDWVCFLEPTNFIEHLNNEIIERSHLYSHGSYRQAILRCDSK